MVEKRKSIFRYAALLIFMAVFLPLSICALGGRSAFAAEEGGTVIDMTEQSFYDCRVYDAADFYKESGSKILNDITYKIRYVDAKAYMMYAVDIPSDANHFYIDAVYGGVEAVVYISTSEDFEDAVAFYPECGTGHKYLTFDAFGEEYFDGNPGDGRLYIKLADKDTTNGMGLQIIDRLRFFHDGTVTENRFRPEVYKESVTGFTPDIQSLNDTEYRIYGADTVEFYRGVRYNTFISTGNVGDDIMHCTYGVIDAPYGIYKFTVSDASVEGYEFSNLMLDAELWGTFRLSLSTGTKIQSEDEAAYTTMGLWTDILCGSEAADKKGYSLDITKFLDDSKVIYLRVTDASDNDREDGGAYVGGLKVRSLSKYIGAPVINAPAQLSGAAGFPVDLTVISAAAGVDGYGASLSFEVSDSLGQEVVLNASGKSFTPAAQGTYTVKITAEDGNKNSLQKSISASVAAAGEVASVTVSDMPAKTVFDYNRPIDVSGGKISLNFSGGDSVKVPMEDCTLSQTKLTTIGANTVTFTLAAAGKSYNCDAVFTCADYIKKIEVYETAVSTYYTGYEELDLSGNSIKAYYEAGKAHGGTEDFVIVDMAAEGVTYSGYYSTDTGEQVLKISYEGCECDFTVTVVADTLTGIGIKTLPKTEYEVGELIDLRDGVMTLTYGSGRTAEIKLSDNAVYFSGYDNSASGKCTVKFEYGGFSEEITVKVGGGESGGCGGALSPLAAVPLIVCFGLILAVAVLRKKRSA